MTLWYRAGSVAVTNGSATVTGVTTSWVGGGIQLGDIFTVDNVNSYEIQGIASDTSLTLDRPYAGTTSSGTSYAIIRNLSPPGAAMMTSLVALTGAVDSLINNQAAPNLGMAAAFQPTAQTVPNMTIQVAWAMLLVGGVPTLVAAQNTATLTAPVSHPRLDLVVADIFTGTVSVVAGTEATSPVLPTLPVGKIPVAKLAMSVGMTAIGSTQITDLRPVFDAGLISGSLNAKSYGAVGDGVTLNATALQNAINACVLAAGGYAFVLDIPGGKYIVNATLSIPSNIRLRGVGSGVYGASGTHLVRNGNFTLISSTNIGSTSPSFALNETVYFDDMCLDGGGNTAWTADLVVLTACYEFKFTRVWFTGCAGRALKTIELWDSRFLDCRFTFCGSQDGTLPAVSLTSPGGTSFDNTSNNIYFWGCRFESNPGVCLEVTGSNGIDVWLTDTKFECVNGQLDYLVRVSSGTSVHFGGKCWMYVSPTNWATKSWSASLASAEAPFVGTVNLTTVTGDTSIYAAATTNSAPAGLSVLLYQTGAPQNYMTGRVNAYNSSTGAIQIITDTAVGTASSASWTMVPCHPGLLYAHSSQHIDGDIEGGCYAGKPGVTTTYQKAFIHLDNCASCDLDIKVAQGTNCLIGASLLAYHDTTTSGNVGPSTGSGTLGTTNFTIETGQTIPVGTILYVCGNGPGYNGSTEVAYNTATDWMTGRVVSYNASTGALVINVDQYGWAGVNTDIISSWLFVANPAKVALLTNPPTTNPKVNITGSASPYSNLVSTSFSPVPVTFETLNITKFGSPQIVIRNLSFQDQFIIDHIPDFTTVNGVTAMTGQYRFYGYDYARLQYFDVFRVDGQRNLNLYAPTLMRNLLRWYDETSGSYAQVQIKGSIGGAAYLPNDGSGNLTGSVGDIWLNSALNAGGPGSPLVEKFVCVSNYYISGATTYPAVYMHPAPLQLSGLTSAAPTSASGYAVGTYYEYTDPVAGGYEGQKLVTSGGSPVWKQVRPIAA